MSTFQPGMANPTTSLFEENTSVYTGQILGSSGLGDTPFPPGTIQDYTLLGPGTLSASVPVQTIVYDAQINMTLNNPAGQIDSTPFEILVSGNLDRPVNYDRDSVYYQRTLLYDAYSGNWQFAITGLVKCFYSEGVYMSLARPADANAAVTWTLNSIDWKIKPLG